MSEAYVAYMFKLWGLLLIFLFLFAWYADEFNRRRTFEYFCYFIWACFLVFIVGIRFIS
jgi:asparagine N-glycosylation enzyme membrane subunit Stt3